MMPKIEYNLMIKEICNKNLFNFSDKEDARTNKSAKLTKMVNEIILKKLHYMEYKTLDGYIANNIDLHFFELNQNGYHLTSCLINKNTNDETTYRIRKTLKTNKPNILQYVNKTLNQTNDNQQNHYSSMDKCDLPAFVYNYVKNNAIIILQYIEDNITKHIIGYCYGNEKIILYSEVKLNSKIIEKSLAKCYTESIRYGSSLSLTKTNEINQNIYNN